MTGGTGRCGQCIIIFLRYRPFRLSFSPEMTICLYQNRMIYFPELKEIRAMLSMVALSSSLLFMHLARCDYLQISKK